MNEQTRPDQGGQNPAAPGREAEEAAGNGVSEQSTRAEGDSESTQPEGGSEAAAEEVVRDLDALEETKRERDEYLELAQRTKADFENYRKRVAGDAASAQRRSKAELAGELVTVLDNLERALLSADIDPAGELSVDGPLEQGIVLTYRDLRATLERAGVEAYDPSGERFDPEVHEAISTRPAGDAEPGTVVDVAQKGYRIDGQVIRAARVVVGE